jgi:hypothetical protein
VPAYGEHSALFEKSAAWKAALQVPDLITLYVGNILHSQNSFHTVAALPFVSV